MLGITQTNRPSSNALELIMPPAFDEKIVTSDEDRKQLRLAAIALAERFVNHLFGCDAESIEQSGLPPLSEFIYRVIRRTNSSITTLFLALVYLIRLKQKHPACKGTNSSPHRLLLAALIIAYKFLYDNCYHNRSWAQVSQGLFKVEEINKMEVELLFFLGFQLHVTEQHWGEFVDFMDGKFTRPLSQLTNKDHLRKSLWVELFPENGLQKLYRHLGHPEPLQAKPPVMGQIKKLSGSRRSTPSLRSTPSANSIASSTTVVNATLTSRHSLASLKSVTGSESKLRTKHKLNQCQASPHPPPVPEKDNSPTSDSSGPASISTCNSSSTMVSPKQETKTQRQLLTKVSSVFSKPGDTLSHAWLDLHSSLRGRRRDSLQQMTPTEQLSKSILSNVTLRSNRRSQKFSLPPIWSLRSQSNETKP